MARINVVADQLLFIRLKLQTVARLLYLPEGNQVVSHFLGLLEQKRVRWLNMNGANETIPSQDYLQRSFMEAGPLSCTVLVIGKSGVGKTATVNSIFGQVIFPTDTFEQGTDEVRDVWAVVYTIAVRVIDTPGLSACSSDWQQNEKILHSVQRFIKKIPPDVVFYVDHIGMLNGNNGDVTLMRSIMKILGPTIWHKTIVVLTHYKSYQPASLDDVSFHREQFCVVHRSIAMAVGDNQYVTQGVFVENSLAFNVGRLTQEHYRNNLIQKKILLMTACGKKFLAEAESLLKAQYDALSNWVNPSEFFISSLLEESLPTDKLNQAADPDKKMAILAEDQVLLNKFLLLKSGYPASLIRGLDPYSIMPTFFNTINHHYRSQYQLNDPLFFWPLFKESSRDYDVLFEGAVFTTSFWMEDKNPVSASGWVNEKKLRHSLKVESTALLNNGEGKETSMCFVMENVGRNNSMMYTWRGESSFNNFSQNSTTAGISIFLLDDKLSAGFKVHDRLMINKVLKALISFAGVNSQGGIAYKGHLGAVFGEEVDNPVQQPFSALSLVISNMQGYHCLEWHMKSEVPIGWGTTVTCLSNLSSFNRGKVRIGLKSSGHLHTALFGLSLILQIVKRMLFRSLTLGSTS